jgi:VWFA-related protein
VLTTLLLAFLLVSPQEAGPAAIRITSPSPGEPLFGRVEVVVETDRQDLLSVEIFVDGQSVTILEAGPYRVVVDVGQNNEEHRFDVRATHPDGEELVSLTSPVFSVDQVVTAELRQLYVTVRGAAQVVSDLDKESFTIQDEGIRQEIVTFGRGDLRLQASILVDSSTSMRGGRLGFALRGAREFMAGLGPEDEASVTLFSDRLLRRTPFSSDPEVVLESLAGVEADGGTALNDQLYLSLKLTERRLGRRVVILLSDGIDSHSAVTMRDVAWVARRSRSMVYWIRTGDGNKRKSRYSAWKSPDDYRRETVLLERLVAESGGRVMPLERIEDAESILREIVQELKGQLVLGYYPSAVRKDGSWHKVGVRAKNAGVGVRARPGYLDF